MTRYDKRFAKSIAKWILNLANANRLFYNGFLPASKQDATAWSNANDPDHMIGYEALREKWQGISPYSTGDALIGGWSATNLSLYSTGSIGYLGPILQKTNFEKVLQLNLLATDFYRDSAYPTFLYYNPLTTTAKINISVGAKEVDIYDCLSEKFIAKNVLNNTTLDLPNGEAMMIVLCPKNGTITYNKNKMLIEGVVVDYQQTKIPFKYNPIIKSINAKKNPIQSTDTTAVYCTAEDFDSSTLSYKWSSTEGSLIGSGASVKFTAPSLAKIAIITCIVTDLDMNADTMLYDVEVVDKINTRPFIDNIITQNLYTSTSTQIVLKCIAREK
jgi:hypothetical protein